MRWRSNNRESVCVESEVSFASDMVDGDRRESDVAPSAQARRCLIMTPIRLAILLCDTPVPPVLKEHGDYHKIFSAWLRGASPSVDFTLDAFDVVNRMEYPPEDAKYDGILLTGSGQPSCLSTTSTLRSDVLSQLLRHTETLNGSISWWSIRPTSCDRGRKSSSSVGLAVSLSVAQTLVDHPSQVSALVTRSSEER